MNRETKSLFKANKYYFKHTSSRQNAKHKYLHKPGRKLRLATTHAEKLLITRVINNKFSGEKRAVR